MWEDRRATSNFIFRFFTMSTTSLWNKMLSDLNAFVSKQSKRTSSGKRVGFFNSAFLPTFFLTKTKNHSLLLSFGCDLYPYFTCHTDFSHRFPCGRKQKNQRENTSDGTRSLQKDYCDFKHVEMKLVYHLKMRIE